MPRGSPRNAAAVVAATPRSRANNRPQVPFAHKLVLNQWLLSLFNVKRFEELAEHLRSESLEGLDENNIHPFHHALAAQFFNLPQLPTDLLLEYDQNIVKHTQQLNERRLTRGEQPIVRLYFQYLTLLFTEIYLDRYFRDPKALLAVLNEQVAVYNADKPEPDQIAPFDETAEAWPQLNKLAYWSATGSGKTLLMHANILQYQHTLEKHGRQRELNRMILLTLNEGLSQQHRREFSDSLFHEINKPCSTVNLLIGSKEFTEGWSSWRVSTMGLMNVGKGEGAQIIQLFGRGVRLKGYDLSLKRSGKT